jgi:hypothetical protein
MESNFAILDIQDDVLSQMKTILEQYLDLSIHPLSEIINLESWSKIRYGAAGRSWFETFEKVVAFHSEKAFWPIRSGQLIWLKRQGIDWPNLCYLQKELLKSQPGLVEHIEIQCMNVGNQYITKKIRTKGYSYERWQMSKLKFYFQKNGKMPALDDSDASTRALARFCVKKLKQKKTPAQ